MTTSQIIGLGGGGFTTEQSPLLDLYIIAASGKPQPKICLLPTASGDNSGYIEYFKLIFGTYYSCDARYLTLIHPNVSNMENLLLDSDIIYVGGGNSKSMLGLWKEWGIDKILVKAYEKGVILAGVSAGFVCWFEQCITDSLPKKITVMNCLGILKGSGCPHFGSNERQSAYHRFLQNGTVKPGYAADDGAALHFINGKLVRAVSSEPEAAAYYLSVDDNGNTLQDKIETEFLGKRDVYDKYISPVIKNSFFDFDNNENEYLEK